MSRKVSNATINPPKEILKQAQDKFMDQSVNLIKQKEKLLTNEKNLQKKEQSLIDLREKLLKKQKEIQETKRPDEF